MKALSKALIHLIAATVKGESYAVFTDGRCAVMRSAPACFKGTKDVDVSSILTKALSATTVTVERQALLTFALGPCSACADTGNATCPTCSGSSRVKQSCQQCGTSHECSCTHPDCVEGEISCQCLGRPKFGRFTTRLYDLRFLRIVLDSLDATELQIGETSISDIGKILVIRCADDFGIVMDATVATHNNADVWPTFALAGASA